MIFLRLAAGRINQKIFKTLFFLFDKAFQQQTEARVPILKSQQMMNGRAFSFSSPKDFLYVFQFSNFQLVFRASASCTPTFNAHALSVKCSINIAGGKKYKLLSLNEHVRFILPEPSSSGKKCNLASAFNSVGRRLKRN